MLVLIVSCKLWVVLCYSALYRVLVKAIGVVDACDGILKGSMVMIVVSAAASGCNHA